MPFLPHTFTLTTICICGWDIVLRFGGGQERRQFNLQGECANCGETFHGSLRFEQHQDGPISKRLKQRGVL